MSRDFSSFQTSGIDLTGDRILVGGDVHTGAADSFTAVTAPITTDILCTIEDIVETTTVVIVLGDGVVVRFIVDVGGDTTTASDTTDVIVVDIEDVIAAGPEGAIVDDIEDVLVVSTDGNAASINDERNDERSERGHVVVDEDDRPAHLHRLNTPPQLPCSDLLVVGPT
tara:strand:+ start:1072 stop:1578 length:507 start_codon:yes stop_codon:yes gene_type:complete